MVNPDNLRTPGWSTSMGAGPGGPYVAPDWTTSPGAAGPTPNPTAAPGAAAPQNSPLRKTVGQWAKDAWGAAGRGAGAIKRGASAVVAPRGAAIISAIPEAINVGEKIADPNVSAGQAADAAFAGGARTLGAATGSFIGSPLGPLGMAAGGYIGHKAMDTLADPNSYLRRGGTGTTEAVEMPSYDAAGNFTGLTEMVGPVGAPSRRGGAMPLPAGVTPSTAGAGRGSPMHPLRTDMDPSNPAFGASRDFTKELASVPQELPPDLRKGVVFKTKDAAGNTTYSGGDVHQGAQIVDGLGRKTGQLSDSLRGQGVQVLDDKGRVVGMNGMGSTGSNIRAANIEVQNAALRAALDGGGLSSGNGFVGINGSVGAGGGRGSAQPAGMSPADIAAAAQKIGLRGANAMAQQQAQNDNALRTALINQDTAITTTGMNNATSVRTTGMNNDVSLRGQDLTYDAHLIPYRQKIAAAQAAAGFLRGNRNDYGVAANKALLAGSPMAAEMLQDQGTKSQAFNEGQRKSFDTLADSMVGTIKGADGKDVPDAELAQMVRGNLLRQNPDIIRLDPDQQQALIAAELPNLRALRAANNDAVLKNTWERWTGSGPFKHSSMPDPRTVIGVDKALPNPFRGTTRGDPIIRWRDASGNVQEMPIPKDQMDSALFKHYMDAAKANKGK